MGRYKAFDDMEGELEEAEESLLEDVEKFQPMQLIHMRKNLMRLRKNIVSRERNSCEDLQARLPFHL